MKKAVYPLLALLIIAADQLSKYSVRATMAPGDRIPVLGDWMSIYYVQNTGAAFSMFAGNKFITVALTCILIIVCTVCAVTEYTKGHVMTSILLTCICSGGISNMIDRLTLGYVTDMLSFWNFAVFNVADIFVTCGCILTIILLFVSMKNESEEY